MVVVWVARVKEWAVVWLEEEAKLKKAESEEDYGAGEEDEDVC